MDKLLTPLPLSTDPNIAKKKKENIDKDAEEGSWMAVAEKLPRQTCAAMSYM